MKDTRTTIAGSRWRAPSPSLAARTGAQPPAGPRDVRRWDLFRQLRVVPGERAADDAAS